MTVYDQREELAKLGMITLGQSKPQADTLHYPALTLMGYTDEQIAWARGVAVYAAGKIRPSYYSANFLPHEWVVLAVLMGYEQ